jgi:hypothetical protein
MTPWSVVDTSKGFGGGRAWYCHEEGYSLLLRIVRTDLPYYTASYLEDRKHFTRAFSLGVVRCLNLNERKSLFAMPNTYFLNGFHPIFHSISNNIHLLRI